MQDMFYNYEHNITEPPKKILETDLPLTTNTTVKRVKNVFGEDLGICALYNTSFNIYFTFKLIEDNFILNDLLEPRSFLDEPTNKEQKYNPLQFEILDFKYEPIATFEPTLTSPYVDEAKVNISASKEFGLNIGAYYMHLYLKLHKTDELLNMYLSNGIKLDLVEQGDYFICDLFSPKDSILYIK